MVSCCCRWLLCGSSFGSNSESMTMIRFGWGSKKPKEGDVSSGGLFPSWGDSSDSSNTNTEKGEGKRCRRFYRCIASSMGDRSNGNSDCVPEKRQSEQSCSPGRTDALLLDPQTSISYIWCPITGTLLPNRVYKRDPRPRQPSCLNRLLWRKSSEEMEVLGTEALAS